MAIMRTPFWSGCLMVELLSTLIGLFVYTSQSQQHIQDSTQRARNAFNVSNLYQQAHYLVVEQQSNEQQYLLSPNAANLANLLSGMAAFEGNLAFIVQVSHPSEHAEILPIVTTQPQYHAAVQQMATALQAGNVEAANQIAHQHLDPLFVVLQTEIDQAATQAYADALAQMDDVTTLEQQLASVLPWVSGLGFLLLCLMGFSLYRSQRLLANTQRREIERLKQSALTDNLTQLGNHRAFHETYQREITQAQRYHEPMSFALIDVDEFKQYNDQHGHAYGDHILKTLAQVLRAARIGDQAFRLGGDEFALLMRHTSLEAASAHLEQLRITVGQQLCGVTISIGIATLQPDAANAATLQEQADAALYEAKRHGRNRLVTFAAIEDQVALLTSGQAQALRDLLQEKQLSIVFQPIWDMAHDAILGFEALMRPHAQYHFAGPQEVFDIAERMGHAHELDAICREAIFDRAHEVPSSALLFINVSPQTLDHEMLAGNALVDAVLAVGMRPEQVVLEITERSVARPEIVVREARRLRQQGFRLALDDAGVGNAGLEMLSQLVVDFVKVDRSVIAKAPTDMTARAVLAGITAIARETNSYVIAEGIEDQATLDFVRMMDMPSNGSVHGVQGYLLGRPSETIPTLPEMLPVARSLSAA